MKIGFGGVIGVVVFVAFASFVGGMRNVWWFGGLAAVALIIGLAKPAKRALARSAFKHSDMHVLQPDARLGDLIDVQLVLEPKRALNVTGAKVKLIAHEYAYYSAGTRSRTYRDEQVNVDEPLDVPKTLSEPVTQITQLKVPLFQPPTFRGEDNRLYTTVKVEVHIDGWPDLELSSELLVLPEVAA